MYPISLLSGEIKLGGSALTKPVALRPPKLIGMPRWCRPRRPPSRTPRRFVLLLFVERAQALDAAALATNGGLAQAAIPVHTLLVASQPSG